MKRLLTFIICLTLLIPNLVACGKDPIVGVWESSYDMGEVLKLSLESNSPQFSDLFDFKDMFLDFSIELCEDGTYSFNVSKSSIDALFNEFVAELEEAVPQILELQYGMPLEDIITSYGLDMTPEEFIESNFSDEKLRESVTLDYSENVTGTYYIEDGVFYCNYKIDDNRNMSLNTKFELDGDTLYFENFVFPNSIEDSNENTPSMPCTLTRKK